MGMYRAAALCQMAGAIIIGQWRELLKRQVVGAPCFPDERIEKRVHPVGCQGRRLLASWLREHLVESSGGCRLSLKVNERTLESKGS